jgi:nitrite reductase/ring-hydroxylating ferredoxin subunit
MRASLSTACALRDVKPNPQNFPKLFDSTGFDPRRRTTLRFAANRSGCDLLSEHEILTFAKVLADRDEGFIELAYQETGEEGRPLPTTVVARSVGSLIVQTRNVKIDIGAESAFPALPAPVEVGGASYFLTKTRDGYKLLSRVCPHQGGTVEEDGGAQFVCHNHGYEYDKDGGRCLTAEGLRMKSYVVNVKEGRLIALLPEAKTVNSALTGQTVQQIADAQGKHVIDALLDMVVEDDLATEFIAPTQGRDTAQFTTEVVESNVIVAGVSDGGAHVKFLTAGIYPTDLLIWLVRDEKKISLEDAHYKLSYLPAHLGGFKDRGAIREQAPADIVVYDLEKLEILPSEVAEDLPGGEWRRIQKSKGYDWILVNGEITFENGEPTGALPGKFLRNGRG